MKRHSVLIWCAWLMYALAWFLPVHKDGVTLPEGLPGWQALQVAAGPLWPGAEGRYDRWYGGILPTISAISNVFFLLCSPWNLARASRALLRAGAWIAAGAFAINAHWYLLYFGRDLRAGYFLWWFSFAVLARGLFEVLRENKGGEEKSQMAAVGQ